MHNQIAETLNRVVSGANAVVNTATIGDSSITVDSGKILDVCKTLKSEGFNVLQVITGCDYADRIELTYILADYTKNLELLVKTALPRGDGNGNNRDTLPKIDSVVSVWNAANFQERETYDMMGVSFVGHPDHRRILTPDDWQGYPLRKDYVVQEKYLDMLVNPPNKINTEDHFFGKKLKAEIGDPKKVSASWKSNDAEETEAEEA
ncbi:NADH-quinone oxidoreductase subunit C [Bacteriovorax sp. PP10]|uniref:NADH-quinone oxidoreductase subunit C n=1 Tax=Bacteriovorax antarcticus TaxID=3088717 RepID=A0ABU5VXD7_9BACT|nr:NADH-quinone oxidoreductase subunit C [Bacteriovorax sp. PP10]MEA9357723.1 NADH-quinone oxidoreductase subunit C [Bacteriovorax sp. PP10]